MIIKCPKCKIPFELKNPENCKEEYMQCPLCRETFENPLYEEDLNTNKY